MGHMRLALVLSLVVVCLGGCLGSRQPVIVIEPGHTVINLREQVSHLDLSSALTTAVNGDVLQLVDHVSHTEDINIVQDNLEINLAGYELGIEGNLSVVGSGVEFFGGYLLLEGHMVKKRQAGAIEPLEKIGDDASLFIEGDNVQFSEVDITAWAIYANGDNTLMQHGTIDTGGLSVGHHRAAASFTLTDVALHVGCLAFTRATDALFINSFLGIYSWNSRATILVQGNSEDVTIENIEFLSETGIAFRDGSELTTTGNMTLTGHGVYIYGTGTLTGSASFVGEGYVTVDPDVEVMAGVTFDVPVTYE